MYVKLNSQSTGGQTRKEQKQQMEVVLWNFQFITGRVWFKEQ